MALRALYLIDHDMYGGGVLNSLIAEVRNFKALKEGSSLKLTPRADPAHRGFIIAALQKFIKYLKSLINAYGWNYRKLQSLIDESKKVLDEHGSSEPKAEEILKKCIDFSESGIRNHFWRKSALKELVSEGLKVLDELELPKE